MSCLAKCCSRAANVERQTLLPVRGGGDSESVSSVFHVCNFASVDNGGVANK